MNSFYQDFPCYTCPWSFLYHHLFIVTLFKSLLFFSFCLICICIKFCSSQTLIFLKSHCLGILPYAYNFLTQYSIIFFKFIFSYIYPSLNGFLTTSPQCSNNQPLILLYFKSHLMWQLHYFFYTIFPIDFTIVIHTINCLKA